MGGCGDGFVHRADRFTNAMRYTEWVLSDLTDMADALSDIQTYVAPFAEFGLARTLDDFAMMIGEMSA
ncbi:hypothetical protein FBY35_2164 [Streptomyces sp. SLBN-118]|nr:hypothetical protein FBY35_2164 [Streptomyces sp. SLBN-118]